MTDARPDDLPEYLHDRAAYRVWLKVYDAGSRTRGWHPADVENALAEAHRALRHLGSRIGPAAAKGFWPPIVKEAEDVIQASQGRRFSPGEVSAMNAALDWAWAHLSEHESERRALVLWCFCEENGIPHARLMREMGLVRRTELHRFKLATLYIAAALCRAEVVIPYEVLIGRLAQGGSDMRDDRDLLAVEAQTGVDFGDDAPAADPLVPDIGTLWLACDEVQEAQDRNSEVLGLILTRVRTETLAGAIADHIEVANARLAKLTTEANRRGLLSTRARGLALREIGALPPTDEETA